MPPLLSSIGAPPFGGSPLARPSGNPGSMADGAQMVQHAVDILEQALPKLDVGHPIHKAVTGAIASLSKHAPPQDAHPGVQRTHAMQQLAQQGKQNPLLGALMARLGGGGGGGANPAGAPGGMPMPSPAPMPPSLSPPGGGPGM